MGKSFALDDNLAAAHNDDAVANLIFEAGVQLLPDCVRKQLVHLDVVLRTNAKDVRLAASSREESLKALVSM